VGTGIFARCIASFSALFRCCAFLHVQLLVLGLILFGFVNVSNCMATRRSNYYRLAVVYSLFEMRKGKNRQTYYANIIFFLCHFASVLQLSLSPNLFWWQYSTICFQLCKWQRPYLHESPLVKCLSVLCRMICPLSASCSPAYGASWRAPDLPLLRKTIDMA
jgi:hypothetical protein